MHGLQVPPNNYLHIYNEKNLQQGKLKKIKQCLIALDHLDMFQNIYMTYSFHANKTAHSQEHIHFSYTAGSCLG
jgi:hypothetical protein